MRLSSRQRVFCSVSAMTLAMIVAGTSLFSQPPPLGTLEPPPVASASPVAPVTEVTWVALEKSIEREHGAREAMLDRHLERAATSAPEPGDFPFQDLPKYLEPFVSDHPPEAVPVFRAPTVKPSSQRVAARATVVSPSPPIPLPPSNPLEMLRDLKITGLITGPRMRAVRLEGEKLRPGDTFDLVNGKVKLRKGSAGTYRLRDIQTESLVFEHLPSSSTLIRPCDRRTR